ncbi:MAG: nucleotidyltransferase domain-containing protein [Candidatus Bathyarchaeota archaeon]|nr:nucleotidyltransferase domain-containing protein [Candidatus Bathyarchaeota archaeon]
MEKYSINKTTLKILGLFLGDYRRSLHVREIARDVGVDVKAVGLQLRRLEDINVLSSIVKGRNKEYRLKLDNLVAKYYMILAETFASIRFLEKNFLIKKLMSETGDKLEGTTVLFGSFAKGEMTEESDIDLFIISNRKPDADGIRETGSLIDREVNIKSTNMKQFLNGLMDNDPLIMEVVSNHIVLKGIDDYCEIMWRYNARQ